MLLAIDAGNTNIVFAVCDAGVIRTKWRLSTSATRTADEYAVWLSQLLQLQGLTFGNLEGAVIGTVVPEPATVALLTCGVGALLIAVRRRRSFQPENPRTLPQ